MVKVAGVEFRGVDEASTGRLRTQLVTKKEFLGVLRRQVQPDEHGTRPPEAHRVLPRPRLPRRADHARGGADQGHRRTSASSTTSSRGSSTRSPGKDIDGNKSFDDRPARLADRAEARRALRPADGPRPTRSGSRTTTASAATRSASSRSSTRCPGSRGRPGPVRGAERPRARRTASAASSSRANDVTRDRVILNQTGPTSGRGRSSSTTRLDDARMRLARLGIFDPEEPAADRGAAERVRQPVQGRPRPGEGDADRAVHGRRQRSTPTRG